MPFRTVVDKNRLICKISWEKTSEKEAIPTMQDIVDFIDSKSIKGVDTAVLDKAYAMLTKQGKIENFPVASGIAPKPSTNGKVKWLFDPALEEIHAGKKGKSGSIDYRERRTFVGVKKDEMLGEWAPPLLGAPGVDVFGEPIEPLKPKDNNIIVGKNVRVSDDATKCYSTMKGHVFVSGNRVSVDKVFKVTGNVDFNTGNIHFPGNVLVTKNVEEGFVVEAEGDVVVDGIVEHAEVRATGNIVVKRGIIRNSRVMADGDLEADFIQDSYAECKGSFIVHKSIIKSNISANQNITLVNMFGSNGIIGGTVNAGQNIFTYNIGTELGVPTQVCAGRNSKLFMKYRQLVSDGLKAKANINRFNKILELVDKRAGEKISAPDQAKKDRMKKIIDEQQKELDSKLNELNTVKEQAAGSTSARIKVFGTAYDGADISVWGIMMHLEQPIRNSIFFFDNEINKISHRSL